MRYTKSFIQEVENNLYKYNLTDKAILTKDFVNLYMEKDGYWYFLREKTNKSHKTCVEYYNRRANYVARALIPALHKLGKLDRNTKAGYVYAITHHKFPGWIKVGETLDVIDRLNSYQTYAPDRSFELLFYTFVWDRKASEKEIISKFYSKNEWVNSTNSAVIRQIKAQVAEFR